MRLTGRQDTDAPAAKAPSDVPVLLVDDNPAKRLALKAVLLPLGYTIVEADSGRAALRCILAQDFAVVLLDVCMPGLDGFETAALIRERRQSEMTPIIFITAFASNEILSSDRFVEGAVDFISAPVSPHELRAKVSVFANLFLAAEVLATRAREVQASADQLRLLTEAAPIGIFQTDVRNRYVYTNPRWSDITGVRPEDAVGRDWDTILSSRERTDLRADSAAEVQGPADVRQHFEIRSGGSALRIVLVTARSLLGDDGGTTGWVGTLADVTAERAAEAALSDARDKATEASMMKSDFLANMSHEIRTPMNGVLGMTELLLETNLDARQRDYAQIARSSGEALLSIIDDILDFSKVEAGKLDIENIDFDARAVVGDVVDLLTGSAQTKGLKLVAVIESSVPAVVGGDAGRVRQVLTNLIANAIKFTQTGEIVVRVSAAEVVGPDSILRFAVSDTGVGIASDKLEVILQPFVQADTSTTRRYGGTGLGLAISSQLVSLMGGSLGLSSELGVGSNFWFTVRTRVCGLPTPRARSADACLAGVSALLVEGEATQRRAWAQHLTDWGMTVSAVDSGQSALATLQAAARHGEPYTVAVIGGCGTGMDALALQRAINSEPAITTRLVVLAGLQHGVVVDGSGSASSASPAEPTGAHLRAQLRVVVDAREADVGTGEAPGRPGAAAPGFAPGRLLLAEDDLTNQIVAVAMLSGAGYEVDTVPNGSAAVEAARGRHYDAILMDCMMPEMNGYEATAAIRAQEGSGRRTPIIALTAGARPEDRERCLAEGMDDYLAKPVSKSALLALVARSVGTAPSSGTALAAAPEAGQAPRTFRALR